MQHGETVIGEAEPDRNYSGILDEHLKLADITTSKLTVSNPVSPRPDYLFNYLIINKKKKEEACIRLRCHLRINYLFIRTELVSITHVY